MENKVIGNERSLARMLPGYDYHSTWSSPEALAKYIGNKSRKEAWDDAGWDEDSDANGFHGSKNMDEAQQRCREGWPEGAEQVDKLRDRFLAANPVAKKPAKYGLVGAVPCVPRAVAGNPMNMLAIKSTSTRRRPTITLVNNMGAYAYVSQECISNKAAAVATIVDQIEAAGYSCEVIAHSPAANGWGGKAFKYGASIMVKQSDQPVDTGRLAYGLGHSSLFRRFVFADRGTSPECRGNLHGMGSTIQVKPTEDLAFQNIYMLPSTNVKTSLYKSPERACTDGIAYLISELKAQGCPAFRNAKDWVDTDEDEDEDED